MNTFIFESPTSVRNDVQIILKELLGVYDFKSTCNLQQAVLPTDKY